jgi:hypothetical protein
MVLSRLTFQVVMVCIRQLSVCKKYAYLYYECKGHSPLSVGRTTKCHAKLVRADRLDTLVWHALEHLLHQPSVLPQLHQTWAEAKQHNLSGLEAQQAQLLQRRQRIERQDQRLLDAYQAEILNLHELQTRRQKLAAELHQIAQESRQLAHTRQQSIHWQQVIDNTETFRQLLGENLAQLSFEERQAIAQCLISQVIVTGEAVDIHFVLPFASTPQAARRLPKEPEGTPGHFYRLRLAHFDGIEMVATMSRQYMQPKLLVPVGQRRRELFRPVDATAVGDHDHLFPSVAKEGHHLMDILAQPLRVEMRDDLIDNARGAILHGADDAEQHAAGDPAPGAIAYPRLAFEGFLAFDLTLAQRARGKASALHFAPPARAGQGKAPQDRFIFIEQNNLATAGPVLQRGKFDRSPRQFSRVGSEPPRGTAVAYVFFFNTSRTLSRLSWTPVWRARTVASS